MEVYIQMKSRNAKEIYKGKASYGPREVLFKTFPTRKKVVEKEQFS